MAEHWVKREIQNHKALPQDETVKKTKIFRMATKNHLQSLDYLLDCETGSGLAQFVRPERLKELEARTMNQVEMRHLNNIVESKSFEH